jgi:hypothetical protein
MKVAEVAERISLSRIGFAVSSVGSLQSRSELASADRQNDGLRQATVAKPVSNLRPRIWEFSIENKFVPQVELFGRAGVQCDEGCPM